MRRLLIILTFIVLSNFVNGQWPTDSFTVIFQQDFEDNTLGLYESNPDDWTSDWNETYNWFNGYETTGIAYKGSSKGMIFYYPNGTSDGVDQGADFECYNIMGTENDSLEMYLSWDIMWKPGFDFVISGKISGSLDAGERWDHVGAPTFYEGSKAKVSWGKATWNGQGYPSLYVYHHDMIYTSGETRQFKNPDNLSSTYYFDTSEEKWVNLTIRVVMNTCNDWENDEEGNNDGLIEGYIDGKLSVQWDGLRLRDVDTIGINNLRIYSQFGGSGPDFATTRDEWLLTDNYVMWVYAPEVEGVPRHNELSEEGRTLNIPASFTNVSLYEGDTVPVVGNIPTQTINLGESFATISLDNYVYDGDNNDDELTWNIYDTVNFIASITDRVATIDNNEELGTEYIKFTVTDPNGNADSKIVAFSVNDTTTIDFSQKMLMNLCDQELYFPPSIIGGLFWNHWGIYENDLDVVNTIYNTDGDNSGFTFTTTREDFGEYQNGYAGTSFPDTCEKSNWRLDNNDSYATFDISGYTIGGIYNLKVYGSQTWEDHGNLEVTFLDTLKSVNTYNNTTILEWNWTAANEVEELRVDVGGGFLWINVIEQNEYVDAEPNLEDTLYVSDTLFANQVDSLVGCQFQEVYTLTDTVFAVGYLDSSYYFIWRNVDFGTGCDAFELRYVAYPTYVGDFNVMVDSLDGDTISTYTTISTGDWAIFGIMDIPLNSTVTGVHDVYVQSLQYAGGNIHWVLFYDEINYSQTIREVKRITGEERYPCKRGTGERVYNKKRQ